MKLYKYTRTQYIKKRRSYFFPLNKKYLLKILWLGNIFKKSKYSLISKNSLALKYNNKRCCINIYIYPKINSIEIESFRYYRLCNAKDDLRQFKLKFQNENNKITPKLLI